jgi:hypothetical protein
MKNLSRLPERSLWMPFKKWETATRELQCLSRPWLTRSSRDSYGMTQVIQIGLRAIASYYRAVTPL